MFTFDHQTQTAFLFLFFWLPLSVPALFAGGVDFHDIAAGDGAGIDYRRTRSARDESYEFIRNDPQPAGGVFSRIPMKARGIPGIAVFDYDNDGDLDIYVTNGPGTANSLYVNQLKESGETVFEDVGEVSGAGAADQDSSGVCFGDIDNDGDHDLYVLGTGEPNRLFRNNGDGTFTDITEAANASTGPAWSSSASMGDVNGDGLLDIFIGNMGDINTSFILFVEPFSLNDHNHLLLNMGGNRFEDVSETSGIRVHAGFLSQFANLPGPTHAVAMVDYDLDGDTDIITADDQAGITPQAYGGLDRGLIHLFQNDGTGHFTDVAVEEGTSDAGSWMGLSFGDYNSDGYMDFFATNLGMYNGAPPELERNEIQNASIWYLGGEQGFTRPGLGDVGATPFGWGTSGADYDNDGDTDIIFYGGLDLAGMLMLSNPGVLLENDGKAHFSYDRDVLAMSTDHTRRVVNGFAVADLDQNGFVDLLSVSNFDIPPSLPLETWPDYNGDFDGIARFLPTFGNFGDPASFRYNPALPDFPDGTLSIELNSGDNGNNSVEIRLMGTRGLTSAGKVNRDAFGAVAFFTPKGGKSVMKPIIGGSSYASQDSIHANFGLGTAEYGTLEVLWPGGVRTRLNKVRAGERILVPELPLSYDEEGIRYGQYKYRIEKALGELVDRGLLTRAEATRIAGSAKFEFLSRDCLF